MFGADMNIEDTIPVEKPVRNKAEVLWVITKDDYDAFVDTRFGDC